MAGLSPPQYLQGKSPSSDSVVEPQLFSFKENGTTLLAGYARRHVHGIPGAERMKWTPCPRRHLMCPIEGCGSDQSKEKESPLCMLLPLGLTGHKSVEFDGQQGRLTNETRAHNTARDDE